MAARRTEWPYKRFGSHNEPILNFVDRVENLRSFDDEYVRDVVIIGRTRPELVDTTAERDQLNPQPRVAGRLQQPPT
jgi:hypothetical protein